MSWARSVRSPMTNGRSRGLTFGLIDDPHIAVARLFDDAIVADHVTDYQDTGIVALCAYRMDHKSGL